MIFKHGDSITGIIYKGGEPVATVRDSRVSKNAKFSTLGEEAFDFDIFADSRPDIEVNDQCKLVSGDAEIEVQVARIGDIPGENIHIVQVVFVFTQPY